MLIGALGKLGSDWFPMFGTNSSDAGQTVTSMANNFDDSMTFSGQKRRVRPVKRVQITSHLEDLDARPLNLATPPPPAPEAAIIKEETTMAEERARENIKVPQAKEAVYATKTEDFAIDEFAFLTGVQPKKKSSPVSAVNVKPTISEKPVEKKDEKPIEKTDDKAAEAARKSEQKQTDTSSSAVVAAGVATAAVAATAVTATALTKEKEPEKKEMTEKAALVTKDASKASQPEKTVAAKEPTKTTSTQPEKSTSSVSREPTKTSSTQPEKTTVSKEPAKTTSSQPEKQYSINTAVKEAHKLTTEAKTNETKKTESKTAEVATAATVTTAAAVAVAAAPFDQENDALLPTTKPPPVPERVDRTSLLSTNSRGVIMDFADSDAGAVATGRRESLTSNSDSNREFQDSLKPRMLPVLPVAEAATKAPETHAASPPIVASNIRPSSVVSNKGVLPLSSEKNAKSPVKLATYAPESQELADLRRLLEDYKLKLEKEETAKNKLAHQVEALKSKTEAQDEALRFKNEKLEKMEADFIDLKNSITAMKLEKERTVKDLEKAEAELKAVNENNAAEYLAKSDEVTKLKNRLDDFAALIGQKDKEIALLNEELTFIKASSINSIFESLSQFKEFDQEFITAVEEEIKKFEAFLQEETEYNFKLHHEVESEYAFWKRSLQELGHEK